MSGDETHGSVPQEDPPRRTWAAKDYAAAPNPDPGTDPYAPRSGRPLVSEILAANEAAARSQNRKILLWIAAAVVAIAGVTAVILLNSGAEQEPVASAPTAEVASGTFGTDPKLDELYTACGVGDMDACDTLWASSVLDSEYYTFGASCGGKSGETGYAAGECYLFNQDERGESESLDALWEACASGEMVSCDDLRYGSPVGSEYADFGATCGGKEPDPIDTLCSTLYLQAVGEDPYMDSAYSACGAGEWPACDEMVNLTTAGSEYYEFGVTCGGTSSSQDWDLRNGCAQMHLTTYGDSYRLDALYDECAGGDQGQCDWLALGTSVGTDYNDFGLTCGGTRALPVPDPQTGAVPPCDTDGNNEYGEDADLDALWDACASGDMLRCRMLGMRAPANSEYVVFASTCGDTQHADTRYGPGVSCWSQSGDTRGTDPSLDALAASCEQGDMAECVNLYLYSEWNTEYSEFGASCGGIHHRSNTVWCEDFYPSTA